MATEIQTRCCIAGGGPAGMMLGLILARAGIEVVVLEKHADFLRDFRGDTVHPSTLELMHELNLLNKFLLRPHDKARELTVAIGAREFRFADFSRIPSRCKFIAMMPQWEFLDLLRDEAAQHSNFRLMMEAEVVGLIQEHGLTKGVQASTTNGMLKVTADLVVGADGRRSHVRAAAGLPVINLGAPIDVLWMRIPFAPNDPSQSGGRIGNGHFLAMIHRGSYWQCAYVIRKGGIDAIKKRGLPAFHHDIVEIAPFFAGRIEELTSWDDIKLLSVSVDRLERWWKPGLLCIGDSAHAMSPIGGIGINLAIQDAVAAGNLLVKPLQMKSLGAESFNPVLQKIQNRRMLPARITQAAQVMIQNRLLMPIISNQSSNDIRVPLALRILEHWSSLRALPAYAIGIGVRPEHINPAT